MLCIDPGRAGTGTAVWINVPFSKGTKEGLAPVPEYAKSKRLDSMDGYRNHLSFLIQTYFINYAIMEDSNYYQGSERGEITAKTDSLVKLSRTIGNFEGILQSFRINYDLVKPQNWKGSLPKGVVEDRITKVIPNHGITSHALDATGIGLWKMGYINKDLHDRTKYFNRSIGA